MMYTHMAMLFLHEGTECGVIMTHFKLTDRMWGNYDTFLVNWISFKFYEDSPGDAYFFLNFKQVTNQFCYQYLNILL